MANNDPFTPEEVSQILEAFFETVGTRQYIGARYVPIFGRKGEESIVWDNSAPYEPLTIVLYQGNSFTSRQYVPKGVEITNEEFWAETGNYNAQIEQYRQDVLEAIEYIKELVGSTAVPKCELLFTGVVPEVSNTPFTIFKIPVNTHIFQFSKRDYTYFTDWRTFLKDYKKPILFVNGSLDGIEISDGVIQRNQTSGNYWTLFGIRNGLPACIDQPPTVNRYTADQMLANGWSFVCGAFAKFIENGYTVDLSVYSDCYSYSDSITARGERTAFGWDDKYFYIFVCNGRRPFANGFNYEELVKCFKYFSIPNGVNMDGGGSTQCYLNNPLFEVTQVSETDARVFEPTLITRGVPFMIGFGDIND